MSQQLPLSNWSDASYLLLLILAIIYIAIGRY